MSKECIVVLCTCPDRETGVRIARALVERREAACVNLVPQVTSVYEWQGNIETDEEHLLVIKSLSVAFPALQETVRRLHPYELPEIIALPVSTGLEPYLAWVGRAVSPG